MGDNPVESWKKQIQWYSHNDYMDNLWNSSGRFSQDSLAVAILSEIQPMMMGKLQCEPRELHRQDHLHVNVQRHCMECQRK